MTTTTETPIAGRSAEHPDRRRDLRWEENRPRARWRTPDLYELWEYRELCAAFVLRNVKVRYKQTFFGVAWAVLQPLIAVLIFAIVFGRLAHLPSEGVPYTVFAYSGMTIWLYFSSSVTAAAQSLVENRELVSKVYFPRVLAPASAVVPPLLDLAISLVVLAVFMAAYRVAPGLELLLLPVWIGVLVALTFTVGLWLAAMNVKYRDVRHALGFLLQVWLFASPVVYAASLVEGGWRYLYAANPIVGVLEGMRWSLTGTPAPGAELAVSLAVGLLLLVTGAVYFRSVESHFADLI